VTEAERQSRINAMLDGLSFYEFKLIETIRFLKKSAFEKMEIYSSNQGRSISIVYDRPVSPDGEVIYGFDVMVGCHDRRPDQIETTVSFVLSHT
jgi:hypothetical protein